MNKKDLFAAKFKEVYAGLADELLQTLSEEKKFFTFRVNTIKSSYEKVIEKLKEVNFPYFAGPFSNSLYAAAVNKSRFSSLNLVVNGEVYIQSFSSMLPVQNLEIKEGEKLLDLCAAPGGKSSYAAAIADNKISLLALDNNFSRINAMKENLEILGVKNFDVLKMDAARAQSLPNMRGYFDKVLVDVPCSNEGLIRGLSEESFVNWNPKISNHLPMLQKKILASALNCIKPGGTVVYSTCTYSPLENEEVIDWALRKFPNVDLVPIKVSSANSKDGFTFWRAKKFDDRLSLTKRIIPDQLFDGFFIAKLICRSSS